MFLDVVTGVKGVLHEVVIVPEVLHGSSVISTLKNPWKWALERVEEETEGPGHQGDVVDACEEADEELADGNTPESWTNDTPSDMELHVDELSVSSFNAEKWDCNEEEAEEVRDEECSTT